MHLAIPTAPTVVTIGYSPNLMFSAIRLPLLPGIESPSHMLLPSAGYVSIEPLPALE